jgi:PAS domain S-box-containing protein
MTLTQKPANIEVNGADEQYELLSRTFVSIIAWQRSVLEVTNALLCADTHQIDAAIKMALAKTSALVDSDQACVFRLRDMNRAEKTHEWVAQGIAREMHQLKDLPDGLLADWRDELGRGQHIFINDIVALPATSVVRDILLDQHIKSLLVVPMLRDGRLNGFVGYESVREHRQFLEPEIEMIQSVADTISAVTERADAFAAVHTFNERLVVQSDRLRATLSAIPDLLLELDGEGRFIRAHSGGSLKPFLLQDNVIGRLLEEVMDAPGAALARKIMSGVDREGQKTGYEYQREDHDGSVRLYQISASARSLESDKGYILLARDITESRRLQSQFFRLRAIAELTSNLVIVTDAQDRIEWVNPAFEKRSGWTLDELKGSRRKSFLQISMVNSDVRSRIGAAIRDGNAFTGELLNKSRSGEEYWTNIDITPIKDSAGTVSGFVVLQSDITDLKRSHERTLQDLAVAIEETADCVVLCKLDESIIYANPAFRQLFGIEPEEDASTINLRDFFSGSPLAASDIVNSTLSVCTWRGELAGRRRDGNMINLDVSLTRRVEGSVVIFLHDITERKRLENVHSKLRDELQIVQRNEMIARLATGVAHDLNNLIIAIDGNVDLIEFRVDTVSEVLSGTKRIRLAMKTARDLVVSLGRLDRSVSRHMSLDLRDLVKNTLYLLGNSRLEQNNVTVMLPDEACFVWGDATDLQQVITNLAINACDAKSDHPNLVKLSVLAPPSAVPARAPDIGHHSADGEYSVFVISDTGTGVEPENHAKLFERYFTTKGKLGTGLGMPVVASIVRENEAALWFDTKLCQGSTVTIAWPSQNREVVHNHDLIAEYAEMSLPLKGKRILIVDDMSDMSDALASLVVMAGATVVLENDSGRALELIGDTTQSFSAILTDLYMPGHNGIDLARAAALRDPALPAILVTALPERVQRHRELFTAILAKPVDSSQLIKLIKAATTG